MFSRKYRLESTKEEYLYRAEHLFIYDGGETFYMLQVNRFTVSYPDEEDGEAPLHYPITPYDSEAAEFYYLKTLQEAEELIPQLVAAEIDARKERLAEYTDKDKAEDPEGLGGSIYSFQIFHVPFGMKLRWHTEFISVRLYDKNGVFLDETRCGNLEFLDLRDPCNRFYGRPTSTQRFKIGDIVEYRGQVGVIAAMPPTPEWCWGAVNRMQDMVKERVGEDSPKYGWWHDITDDSYQILFDKEGGHDHPQATCLVPLQIPISEEYMKRLNEMVEYVKHGRDH